MKRQNYSYVGISLVILIFGIYFIPKIINRIMNGEVVDKDRHQLEHNLGEKKSNLAVIGKVPAFQFLDQHNDTITDDTYKGKVYVAEFFFTTCPSICPIMNQNMLKVEEAFQGNNEIGIASFTINPDYDTVAVLNEYAEKYGMTHPNWHLLTGDRNAIFDLANTGFNLYVGAAENVEGGFEHSGFFALIDQNGNIRSRKDENQNPIIYYDGLEDSGIKMLIEDIKILLKS